MSVIVMLLASRAGVMESPHGSSWLPICSHSTSRPLTEWNKSVAPSDLT
jgi:hypothetical protein